MINSDPGLIELFLRFLEPHGRARTQLTYRLSIHETADVALAQCWWQERLGLVGLDFKRATIKRHRINTKRRNVGDGYHGCLVVEAQQSRTLYWLVDGTMSALVDRST